MSIPPQDGFDAGDGLSSLIYEGPTFVGTIRHSSESPAINSPTGSGISLLTVDCDEIRAHVRVGDEEDSDETRVFAGVGDCHQCKFQIDSYSPHISKAHTPSSNRQRIAANIVRGRAVASLCQQTKGFSVRRAKKKQRKLDSLTTVPTLPAYLCIEILEKVPSFFNYSPALKGDMMDDQNVTTDDGTRTYNFGPHQMNIVDTIKGAMCIDSIKNEFIFTIVPR